MGEMSGGYACNCSEREKPVKDREWVVFIRRANRSAFNGYRRTPSDYSGVFCKSCGAVWRTNARYVDELRFENFGRPRMRS